MNKFVKLIKRNGFFDVLAAVLGVFIYNDIAPISISNSNKLFCIMLAISIFSLFLRRIIVYKSNNSCYGPQTSKKIVTLRILNFVMFLCRLSCRGILAFLLMDAFRSSETHLVARADLTTLGNRFLLICILIEQYKVVMAYLGKHCCFSFSLFLDYAIPTILSHSCFILIIYLMDAFCNLELMIIFWIYYVGGAKYYLLNFFRKYSEDFAIKLIQCFEQSVE